MEIFPQGPLRLVLFALAPVLLPLAGYAQGYAEGLGLSYEVLPLKLSDAETSFRADVYRANVIVPLALVADSSRGLLLGASLEALRFSGPRPGFAVGNVY